MNLARLFQEQDDQFLLIMGIGVFLILVLAALLIKFIKARHKRAVAPLPEILLQAKSPDQIIEKRLPEEGMASLYEICAIFPELPGDMQSLIKATAHKDYWITRALEGNQGKPPYAGSQWAVIWRVLGDPALLPQIIKILSHKEESVRMLGVEIITNIGDIRIIPYLVSALLQPKLYLPARVCEALLAFGENSADILAKMLPGLEKASQAIILDALAQFNCLNFIQPVVECLESEYAEIRLAAIEALGNSGQAIGHLLQAAGDKSWKIRSAVAKALGQTGSASAIPKLQELLEDEYFIVQANAKASLDMLAAENLAEAN